MSNSKIKIVLKKSTDIKPVQPVEDVEDVKPVQPIEDVQPVEDVKPIEPVEDPAKDIREKKRQYNEKYYIKNKSAGSKRCQICHGSYTVFNSHHHKATKRHTYALELLKMNLVLTERL
jgi:hypothetical protein